ncbi:MAG: hypothetical protein E3J35_06545 [Methanomassiliicoccales archaeon]|nr:MAG: hypothetical protein E3J35_06545 [Methanomassiliicoccales archaeon]
MSWPAENEVVSCDVCEKKVGWVGKDSPNYTVLDGPPSEPEVTLVCKDCEALMEHFGFSTYAMKRFMDLEKKIEGMA